MTLPLMLVGVLSLPMATASADERLDGFDPVAATESGGAGGVFTATGRFSKWREGLSIVPRPDGTVFVYGDARSNGGKPFIFDGRTGVEAELSHPPECPRSTRLHSTTPLPGDRVLIAGGICGSESGGGYRKLSLWDGASRTWLTAPLLGQARVAHTATALADGSVLIVGGGLPVKEESGPALKSVELFRDGSVSQLAPLGVARARHTATPLSDGSVLVAGGTDEAGAATASVELWDPASQAWRGLSPMLEARAEHSATLLEDGRVMVAGGKGADGRALRSVEFWEPARNNWVPGEALLVARAGHSAVRLTSGDVLLVGDVAVQGPSTALAMVWSKSTGHWRPAGTLRRAMRPASATVLPNDTGGATVYGAQTIVTWKPTSGAGQPGTHYGWRDFFSATVLKDGRVMLAGGSAEGALVDWVELFDARSNEFLLTGRMQRPRRGHSVQLLGDGRVVVAGGEVRAWDDREQPWVTDHPEVWDPTTGQWRVLDAIGFERDDSVHMTVLGDGRVLFFAARAPSATDPGGYRSWIWEPRGDRVDKRTFSVTPRARAAIALLRDGHVLVVGGQVRERVPAVTCGPGHGRQPVTDEEVEECVPSPESWELRGYGGAELLNGLSGGFSKVEPPRNWFTDDPVTLVLRNGDALLLNPYGGGSLGRDGMRTVVRWRAATRSWDALPSLPAAVRAWPMVELADGGLATPNGMLPAGGGQWEQPELQGAAQTIVSLPSGRVIGLSSVQPHLISFDPVRAAWQIEDNAYVQRTSYPAVAVLPDGNLFVSGGIGASKRPVVQIWNPDSGAWTHAGQMKGEYLTHNAVTIPSGRVVQVGYAWGEGGRHMVICEIGDPKAQDWKACGSFDLRDSGQWSIKELVTGTLPDGRAAFMLSRDEAYVYLEDQNTWVTMSAEWFDRIPFGAPVRLEKPLLSLHDRQTGTWLEANELGAKFRQATSGGSMAWDAAANQFAYVFADGVGKNGVRLKEGCFLAGPPLSLAAAGTSAVTRYAGWAGVDPREARLVAFADGRFAILGNPEGAAGFGAGFFTGRASCSGIEGLVAESRAATTEAGTSIREIIFTDLSWKDHFAKPVESTALTRFPWVAVFFFLFLIGITVNARRKRGSSWLLTAGAVLLTCMLIYILVATWVREAQIPEGVSVFSYDISPDIATANVEVPRLVPCRLVGVWTMRRTEHVYSITLDGNGRFVAEKNIYSAGTPPERGTWGVRDNHLVWANEQGKIFAMHEIISQAEGRFRLMGSMNTVEDFELLQPLPRETCSETSGP